MCWIIGQFIAGGLLVGIVNLPGDIVFKLPFGLQVGHASYSAHIAVGMANPPIHPGHSGSREPLVARPKRSS